MGRGENYDSNLAQELAGLGHRIRFLSGRIPGSRLPARLGGMEMIAVETPYLRRHMYRMAGKVPILPGLAAEADRRLFELRAMHVVKELASSRSIDVVQILGLPRLAERVAGTGLPVVVRFPGPPAWFWAPRLRRLERNPKAAMFAHGDAVGRVRSGLGIHIHEVPPGVRADIYRPAGGPAERRATRSRLGLAPEHFVLVTVGRLIAGKGHDFLLESMAKLAHRHLLMRLLVVGDGPLRQHLEGRVRRLGIANRVIFAGQRTREGVAQCLAASDLFCLLSEYENYSNAVLEAMSCGLPVLATKAGGFPLQVREGVNGILVNYGDCEDLAEKATEVARSPGMLAQLSAEAKHFASGFHWRASAERVERIYSSLVAT